MFLSFIFRVWGHFIISLVRGLYFWTFQILLINIFSITFLEVLFLYFQLNKHDLYMYSCLLICDKFEIHATLSLAHLSFMFCLCLIISMWKFFVFMKKFPLHVSYDLCIYSRRRLFEHQFMMFWLLNKNY